MQSEVASDFDQGKVGDWERQRPRWLRWISESRRTSAFLRARVSGWKLPLRRLEATSDDLPGGFVVEDPAVVVGAGEFGCGLFVEAEDGGGVELERGGRIHRGNGAFDGLGNGLGFVLSRGEEDGFAGVEDGSDTHGDDMKGNDVLAAEEAGVVLTGAGGEGFDAGA